MKFKIIHEIRGRMRIHMACRQMTFKEADILQYYLSINSISYALLDSYISIIIPSLLSFNKTLSYNFISTTNRLLSISCLLHMHLLTLFLLYFYLSAILFLHLLFFHFHQLKTLLFHILFHIPYLAFLQH